MKSALTIAAFLVVLFAAALLTYAQQKLESSKAHLKPPTGKHYSLAATPENVQWGWFDVNEKPRLVLNSGDTVSVETLMHSLDQIKPGVEMDEIVKLRLANDGGGPHSLTGPIYVNGAEPGDTMEIRIIKIVPKDDGFNFHLPGKQFPAVGLLAPEFPDGYVHYFKLDWKTRQTEFKPGIVLDLKPFP